MLQVLGVLRMLHPDHVHGVRGSLDVRRTRALRRGEERLASDLEATATSTLEAPRNTAKDALRHSPGTAKLDTVENRMRFRKIIATFGLLELESDF